MISEQTERRTSPRPGRVPLPSRSAREEPGARQPATVSGRVQVAFPGRSVVADRAGEAVEVPGPEYYLG